MYTIQCGEDS